MQILPSGLGVLSLMGRFIRVGPVSLLIQVNCVSSHMRAQSFQKRRRYFRGVLRCTSGGELIVSVRAFPFLKHFRWIFLSVFILCKAVSKPVNMADIYINKREKIDCLYALAFERKWKKTTEADLLPDVIRITVLRIPRTAFTAETRRKTSSSSGCLRRGRREWTLYICVREA